MSMAENIKSNGFIMDDEGRILEIVDQEARAGVKALTEENANQGEQIAALQGKAYKDYMEGEIAAVTERLQAIQYAAPNSTTFAFCTDLHYREFRDPVRLQNIMGGVAAISKECVVIAIDSFVKGARRWTSMTTATNVVA